MSDNNEPVDLEAIEGWYNGLYRPEINMMYEPWAKYITDLVAEVKRLRADYTKHTANLNNIIDSNHREIWKLQKELAEAKRTQVKNGGRMRLRPFPEPGEIEL